MSLFSSLLSTAQQATQDAATYLATVYPDESMLAELDQAGTPYVPPPVPIPQQQITPPSLPGAGLAEGIPQTVQAPIYPVAEATPTAPVVYVPPPAPRFDPGVQSLMEQFEVQGQDPFYFPDVRGGGWATSRGAGEGTNSTDWNAIIDYETQPDPTFLQRAIGSIPNIPLLTYPTGATAQGGLRTGSVTVGDVAGGAYDAYMTDVPFGVSDFIREEVVPRAGDVGAFIAPRIPGAQTAGAVSEAIGGPSAEDVGRFAGESAVPVTAGDFVVEALPGIGFGPDVVRWATRSGILDEAGRVVSRTAPELLRVARASQKSVDDVLGIVSRAAGAPPSGGYFAGVPTSGGDDFVEQARRVGDDVVDAPTLPPGGAQPPVPPAAVAGATPPFSEGDAVLALRNALREPQGERARVVAAGRKRQAARISAAVEGTTSTGQSAAREAGQAGAGKILPEDGLGFKLPKEADDALVEKALQLYRDGKMSVFDAVYGVPRALDEGRRLGPTETQAKLLSKLTAIDESAFAPFVRTRSAMDQNWRQVINDEVAKVGLDEAPAVRTQIQAGKRSELTAAHLDARGQAEQAASARLRAETHYAKADALRAEQIRKASEKAITDEIKAIGRVNRRAQVLQRRAMRTIGGLENRAMREESERLARLARHAQAAQESWNNAMSRSPSQALKDEADLANRMTDAFPTVDRSPRQILQDAAERITDETFKGALETRSGLEALEALRYHLEGNRVILGKLHNAEGIRRWVGAARAGVTGELADSYLTSLIHRNHTLGQALTDLGMEPKVVSKVSNEVLNAELRMRFPEGIPDRVIKELDTMKGAPYEESLAGLQLLSQRFKNSMFGLLDMGIFGVQTLAAIRRGGIPLLAGNINKVLAQLHAPHIDTDITEVALQKRLRNMIDGVGTFNQSGSSVRAGTGSMLSYLGPWGKAVDQKVYSPIAEGLNEVQFGNVLGWVRDNAYEGNLVMLNILRRDITNPETRRIAAETANAISSFAQGALRSSRAGVEGTLLTSPAMTRSQAANILQMSKLLNPKASLDERVMAAGLIASQVGFYLTIGKYLNDQIGITDFVFDPSEKGFGLITTNDKDANGNNRVLNLFPQMSIDRAFAQSIRSLAEGNEQDALDSWLRYFSGRTGASPVGGPLLALGGVGYSSGLVGDLGPGRFSKDLSPADRLLKLVPLPPMIMSALNQAQDGFDAISTVFDYFGMSEFPESQYGTEDRAAKDLFNSDYWDLPTSQQVLVHRAMRDAGEDLTDEAITGPFFGSWRQAFEDLQAQSPELSKYADSDAFRARVEADLATELGRTPHRQEVDAAFDEVMDALGHAQRVNAYKLMALALDPNIIDAWQRQYDAGDGQYAPAKKWLEAAATFIKYPEQAREVLAQLKAAGYDVPEIPEGIKQWPDAKPQAEPSRLAPTMASLPPSEFAPTPPMDEWPNARGIPEASLRVEGGNTSPEVFLQSGKLSHPSERETDAEYNLMLTALRTGQNVEAAIAMAESHRDAKFRALQGGPSPFENLETARAAAEGFQQVIDALRRWQLTGVAR